MHQLIRGGGGLSRGFLRSGRQAFSTSQSAASIGAQTLMAHPSSSSVAQNHNNRRGYLRSHKPSILGYGSARLAAGNEGFALSRDLSSMATATEQIGDDVQSRPTTARKPSALQQAGLPEITPGHALYVLQRYASNENGNRLLRQSDVLKLCKSARPGKMKDAKVIATALKDFKRCNRFVIQKDTARAALRSMLLSMMPTWKVQDGRPRVRAASFAAEQIMDETTGLYFAVETQMVNTILEEMHKGLVEMSENGFSVKFGNIGAEEEEGEEPSPDEKLVRDALRATEGVFATLLKRKSRPEWDMKKRARRVYMKRLQHASGPHGKTVELAAKISAMIGGSAIAEEKIVTPFDEAWFTKYVDERALNVVKEAKELEQQEADAVAAAAAEGEAEADQDETEDAEDEGVEEDESQTEAETDEVKKE